MLAVLVSRPNRASEHVGEHLLDLADWEKQVDESLPDGEGGDTYYQLAGVEMRTFDELHLRIEDAADAFNDPDLLFFPSSHAGDTGPLLTAHCTGNFGSAEYGGRDGDLAEHAPNALTAIVEAFDEHAPDGYDVGMECTHHGPSRVGCPSLFVELGSGEQEWNDAEGARAVARAILDCRDVNPRRERTLVGFGGNHYVPRFERIVRETDWAVGHVAADWALEDMGDPCNAVDVVAKAFERSGATRALIEGDYPRLEAVVGDLGYRVVGETWVRETSGVPLPLVERVESTLGRIDEGVRFGARAGAHEGGFVVRKLPVELLEDAVGFDRDAVREAVHERVLAYATAEGGTRVTGKVALDEHGARDVLIDALAAILAEKYDAVVRKEGAIIARDTAFDPERARQLGVPEGPAFGQLSAGETVEVDGERIDPADVHEEREIRYSV